MNVARARAILLAFLLLSSCSGRTDADLAACKVKATELFKPEFVDRDTRSGLYVRDCMTAAGYRLRIEMRGCIYPTASMLETCWN